MAGEPGGAAVLGAVMLVCVCWGLPSWHLPVDVASLAEDDARRHPWLWQGWCWRGVCWDLLSPKPGVLHLEPDGITSYRTSRFLMVLLGCSSKISPQFCSRKWRFLVILDLFLLPKVYLS